MLKYSDVKHKTYSKHGQYIINWLCFFLVFFLISAIFKKNKFFSYLLIYLKKMDKVMLWVQSLLKTAKAVSGSPLNFINTVYFWDPKVIAESNLPAITISPSNTEFERRGSRYDQKIHDISIKLVLNMKDLFQTSNDDIEIITAVQKLILAVEETGDNHETLDNTVCAVIQKNPCLEYTDGWSTVRPADDAKVVNVSYWEGDRAFPSYEADVTISVSVVGDR